MIIWSADSCHHLAVNIYNLLQIQIFIFTVPITMLDAFNQYEPICIDTYLIAIQIGKLSN